MIAAISVLHVIVCIFLIAVVLLQRGKGAEMGAVFGGGASSTVFGSRGAGNFLTLLTKICAALFMLTSLSLSYLYTEEAGEGLFEGEASQAAPFDPADTALPDEAGLEAPPTDPVDPAAEGAAIEESAVEDAAIAEPTEEGADAADGNP